MTDTADWIRDGSAVTGSDLPLVGGKAVGLARLQAFGQRVPPWYAVTTEAFRRVRSLAELDARLRGRLSGAGDNPAERDRAADEIQRWIRGMKLPSELGTAVAGAHARLIPDGAHVAVRSSATAEDAATDSFAGLHDSFLFVTGHRELLDAVRGVWASAFNPRALAYRLARGISIDDISVAVVVQQMVHAQQSGVMFTVNPNSGDVYEVVISALPGAGEGLVSAGLDADTFVVDKESFAIDAQIADKAEQLVFDDTAGRGLRREPIPEASRAEPSLTADQVGSLARAGVAIERSFGRPQDVEFSFDSKGQLFVLQSRPVTTVEEYGPAAGNRLVWDNSNIIESYSGVTSPMTFSFIRHAYTIVYHCFAEVMGISAKKVRANRHTFENMLGLFRGQVYYNLRNWYALVHLFPGFNYNRKFMESMMGVRESARFTDDREPESWVRRYFVELPALARLVLRSGFNFLRIRRLVGKFEDHFREHYDRWSAMDLSVMPPHELRELYLEMEDKLLWNWKAPIVNDFYVMIFYGTLKKLCTDWCGDESGSLQNDLICGEGGIESTQPTKLLQALAARADRDPELREFLLARSPEELAAELPAEPRFREFHTAIEDYLDRYGFRCVNELKLEEYSLRDRPAFLFQVLRNYLGADNPQGLDIEAAERREKQIRTEAELRAAESVGRYGPRGVIFGRVLRNARLGVKNRENMRFARTRIYGLLRELLRAIGEQLHGEGLLDARDDIFYLTIDEVWDYVKGTAVTTDLRALTALRRREFDAYRDEEDRQPDDRFETFGLAYHRNRFKGRQDPVTMGEDGVLSGTGCCPGLVTAPVKVLRSPSEDAELSGEILVAERTDPGWVPLYPSVSGILIERGSILSHSAIVAREMGIPTIVGIPGLTATFRTGQRVTMDGAAGTVRPAGAEGVAKE